jgi:hypothetical protein
MDFFRWGQMNALIFTPPVDSKEDLIGRIVEAVATRQQN